MNSDEIAGLVDRYDKEAKSIKEDCLKLTWFMRGGITYTEAINLSHSEKESIGKIIKDNMETTKKTGLNFF